MFSLFFLIYLSKFKFISSLKLTYSNFCITSNIKLFEYFLISIFLLISQSNKSNLSLLKSFISFNSFLFISSLITIEIIYNRFSSIKEEDKIF